MAKPSRCSLFVAYSMAFVSAWMPRLPFLRSKRFWTWTVSVFSISFLSLFIGLRGMGAGSIEIPDLIAASLAITIPCQTIGMIIHWWIDQRREEHRGFEVLPPDEEAI